METLFWLLPGRLAGRAGPDREPWDIEALYQAGIRAVLSVNDGRLVHGEDFEARGMVYACVPFTDNAPPRPEDLDTCRAALADACLFVQAQIDQGNPVMVHCSSGKDRTGVVGAYFLMRRFNCSAGEAISKLRAVRPIALSALGWEEFAHTLLDGA